MLAKASNPFALQNTQTASAKTGKSPIVSSTPQQSGYQIFHPGTYEYSLEILLDYKCPETINLPSGSVRWILEAVVERGGAFKSDVCATKEILVVRAPDTDSHEYVQPIPVRKLWDNQLHYDIVFSGKSFPIGSKIPIAFKLTPLTKVQCHGIMVYITEHVTYLTDSKRERRICSERKILLLERLAGRPLAGEHTKSEFRILSGGDTLTVVREETRDRLQKQREEKARRLGRPISDLPRVAENLLGDLDFGLDHLTCQTEIEIEVQLPTCAQMSKDGTNQSIPIRAGSSFRYTTGSR
jgi:hypothetical protein